MTQTNSIDRTTPQLAALKDAIRQLESVVVAYSGGVDSTLLLAVAHDVLGPDRCLGVTGISPSLAPEEYEDAKNVAEQIGATWIVIETGEMDDPGYRQNDADRCYYCKRDLFARLRTLADERGYAAVIDGTNADDEGDWRPGERAGREIGIRSPLKETNIGKQDIRELSRLYGLPTADKQSFACLASRLPYGTQVTPERLEQVARAETALRNERFHTFRVRYHGDTARLELGPDELHRVADPQVAQRLVAAIRAEGFQHIAVDLAGFRSGSQNEKSRDSALLSIANDNQILREAGFVGGQAVPDGKMVRLILPTNEMNSVWDPKVRTALVERFRENGYLYVAADLAPRNADERSEDTM